MFLGDVSSHGATRLTSVYNNALKADFVQVAHHGLNYDWTIRTLYQAIDAKYVLYPACNDWYRGNITEDANNYLETSSTVKQIFVSGLGTIKLYLTVHSLTEKSTRIQQFSARLKDQAKA